MDTEKRLERYRDADAWPTEESLAAMLENQMGAFAAVRDALPMLAEACRQAAQRLDSGGRLVYVGAGASGRLAVQDGVELLPTFSWPRDRIIYLMAGGTKALVDSVEGAEDDAAAGAAAIDNSAVGAQDVVVSVAASGTTQFTRGAQNRASERGALTVAMANNPGAPLLTEADIPILLYTGPEFLAGSTRMTAGTAQKVALNMFSTQTMIELGRVYHGFMVNVVPANAKLVDRSKRIIQAITDCDDATVEAAWSDSEGDLKLAILLVDGLTREEARARLEQAGGNLRVARPAS